ncbi:MAG: PEP-CTERM sorting domain-containing protein [Pirellulaceae bacterium]|nr:PEP-CTERM sorting domain-containing protein [Pirellulaceae bacterium]
MKRFTQIAMALAITVAANQAARANLVINVTSSVNSSTGNTHTGTATDKREFNSTLTAIQSSDSTALAVNNTALISTRLAALTLSDKDSNTNTLVSSNTQNATVSYSVTFSITAPSYVQYEVDLGAIRRGELTVLNESTGHGGNAVLTLGAITTSKSGSGSGIGTGLNSATASFTSPNGNNSSQWFHNPVSQSGSEIITGLSGNSTITIGFTWAQNAVSSNSGGLFNNGQGDDGAIRLGGFHSTNALSGIYPGANSRNQADDGHFFTATARITQIPEPSSALLVLSSLVGLTGFRRRAC